MADYNNRSGRRGGGFDRSERGVRQNRGGRPEGERGFGERRFGDKPYGERKFGDKPYGERKFGDKPYGERKFGDKPYGERKFGDKPYGERKFGDKPYGERKFGDKPYGERRFGDKPYGERRFGDRPAGDKPFDKKPYGERSFGEKRFGDDRFEQRPYGKKPFDGDRFEGRRPDRQERPFDERRFDKKPFEGKRGFDERRFDERRPEHGFAPAPEQEPQELPNIIMGRNPVKEAIKSGRSIDRILVTKEHDGSLGEIIGLAKDRNLIIREVDRRKLDELCMPFGHDGKSGNHQGIVAEIPGVEYSELSDILDYAKEKGEKPFVIMLDGIEDPHNLGSIIRSAECAGAHGVVIPKRRSAPVTATVVKTSAGAAEHMRIARVVNLVAAMEQLKDEGLWIAGADMSGKSMYEADMKGGFALVIGGEGDGLSKLVREKCDFLVSIPLRGSIDSLNAAVAAAIIMFEKNRQDGVKAE
ncbi:MAG: 23S rRNA (guanosine(2251)-2'-O)-methyltransferase RlmB [Clostridia bacterium]|nr:23S rRNA (guanosine(2251)-2'-O)-methyltransferase RlmB [Clostridia bacterium]